MTEKTFEEEFPSFKDVTSGDGNVEWDILRDWTDAPFDFDLDVTLVKRTIQQKCLDKRRVKEVINNAYMNSDNDARLDSTEVMKAILFKELGLEDLE